MNTEALEKAFLIIGYWVNGSKAAVKEILNSNKDLVKTIVEPFSKELDENLLERDNKQAKKDLIKFYVFKFWELQGFFKEYYEIIFTGILSNKTSVSYEHTSTSGVKRKLNKLENYYVNSYEVFTMLFDNIQLCCHKYEVGFFEVCNELKFSTDYIDCGVTIGFNDKHKSDVSKLNLVKKQESQEDDILFFDNEKYSLEFQMGFPPENILNFYKDWNEFVYLNTSTTKNIPVTRGAYNDLQYLFKENKELEKQFDRVFYDYAKGFIEGFKIDFKPFVDTPENRKEKILRYIFPTGGMITTMGGFPVSHTKENRKGFFTDKSFFEMGVKFGSNYRAWMVILETPKYYENDFPLRNMKTEKNNEQVKYYFNYNSDVRLSKVGATENEIQKAYQISQVNREMKFIDELKNTKVEGIKELIDFHLRYYTREQGGTVTGFANNLKRVNIDTLNKYQRDKFITVIEELDKIESEKFKEQKTEIKEERTSYFIDESFFTGKYFDHYKSLNSFTFSEKEFKFKMPVYAPELMLILNTSKIPAVTDINVNESVTFNGLYYKDTYIKAFKEGVEYFEKNFAITTDNLYGANNEFYLMDLQENYFRTGCKHTGWIYVKRFPMNIVNQLIVYEYGYYSGIVSRVDELRMKYPKLFKAFDKYEPEKDEQPKSNIIKTVPPQEREINTEQQKPNFEKELSEISVLENKFWKGFPMQKVIEHFKILTERKSKNGEIFLTTKQLISFLKKGFLEDTKQSKQKINVANGEKGFVIKRFYEFFDLAVSQYEYPNRKAKFYKLFTDCFDNWKQDTIKPFFKPKKVKGNW